MRGLRWVDDIVKTGSWTCQRCLRGRQNPVAHLAAYTTNPGKLFSWTFSAQRDSQPRRRSYKSSLLKDFTLARSELSSFPFNGSSVKHSTREKVPVSKGKKRGVILAILTIGSIWAFSDDAKHRYVAVKRALRVFYALVRCLVEYVSPSVIRHLQQC